MKTFFQLREELENLNEAEDSKVTSSIEKKDPDAMHMSTHGTQHVYVGGQSDRENHSYHVHDTSTGKTHHVSLDHGGKAMSHGAVKAACGPKVGAAACKAIHSDHKDELSESVIDESTQKWNVGKSQIAKSKKALGGDTEIGHGAHDLVHPDDDGPNAPGGQYGHLDPKTKKFSAVTVKFGHKTSAKKVAKAMGHKEVGPHHHEIADYHNKEIYPTTV